MIAIVPLELRHLAGLELQTAQRPDLTALAASGGAELAAQLGPAFTALERVEGQPDRVIACAGLAETHPRYATAWALFGEGKGAGMVAITRSILRVLEVGGYARVDMLVRNSFDRAHDFARLLRFEPEGLLRRYGADGSDFMLYARIF